MNKDLEKNIEQIVVDEMAALNRNDLFRKPLLAFSSANDPRYSELKQIVGEWHLNPTELLPDAVSVISYFVPFTKKVVAEPKTVKDGSLLWGEAYVTINAYFDHINEAIAEYLNGLGFICKTIKATHTYDPKDLKSMWSHRSAAAIAGLGVFGTNRLLITEKGSGGRFCTVITTAPLNAGSSEEAQNRCFFKKDGSCGLCIEVCPVNALSRNSFSKFTCQIELNKNGEKESREGLQRKTADTCGKCISVCPVSYFE
jgi:epoxyqueuosine reductase QueG